MQLIKSLFCWHGVDNRQRFIIISIICFVTFIFLTVSLINHKLSSMLLLLFCSAIYLFTTQRRLNDAKLKNQLSIISTTSFIITGLITIFFYDLVSYWLLLLPLLPALFILTYPSQGQKPYIFGYHGPVDLSDLQQTTKVNSHTSRRVEPTMHSININQPSNNESQYSAPAENSKYNPSTTSNINQAENSKQSRFDLGETIRLTLLSHNNSRLIFAAISFVLLLALIISMMTNRSPTAEIYPEKISEAPKSTNSFQHSITLPDNFSIMMSSSNGIVINWQADVNSDQEGWTLATATGDKNCENIAFDKGEAIRPFSVSVIDSDYYAYFSPLDTKTLLQNIAFKNKFSLCGYNFSLKGSQATLGKSNFYANLIEY